MRVTLNRIIIALELGMRGPEVADLRIAPQLPSNGLLSCTLRLGGKAAGLEFCAVEDAGYETVIRRHGRHGSRPPGHYAEDTDVFPREAAGWATTVHGGKPSDNN